MQQKTSQCAFSLIELSIVLVILGLLTGGILAGQSLIRASELRSLNTDLNKYLAATLVFRDKYFAIPGDMANATSFWGSLGSNGADSGCQLLAATAGTATCNGNGNGSLFPASNVGPLTTSSHAEMVRFWQHLANAGLIEGQYTGYIAGTANTDRLPGVNVPAGKIPSTYFYAEIGFGAVCCDASSTYSAGSTTRYAGDYGRGEFWFNTLSASWTASGSFALKPEELWNVDTKMDDGNPAYGRIIAIKGNGTNTFCTTSAGISPPGDANSSYKLDNSARDCAFYYTKAF
ncbi:type II secretion system protein [Sphingobium terrigena]|uniref:type II secretion system protein n=1 Tax=Sphingobium terrigena TaxID=2304063 RepID=UPI001600A3FE|nr:prepilin-type N-terminal cleavage/methylation domain-containing protein [Sphingobium terrigena]